MAEKPPEPPPPPRRDKTYPLRLDSEMHKEAMKASRPYGGLAAVLRAFIRAFISGERNFDIDTLSQENTKAPPRPREPKKNKKA